MGSITANWELQTSRTLVLAIYPSKGGREALAATVSLARRSGSSVVVVCVREHDVWGSKMTSRNKAVRTE
jgi:hypothetical protein